MVYANKFKVIGISALFLVASAFLVFGGPLGNLVFATGPVTAVEVSAVDEATRLTPVSTIDVNNGTIRMIATLTPAAPDDASIVWTVVNGTGSATIDRCGQLFAATNGTVTARGTSHSSPTVFGEEIITITNQLQPIDIGTGMNYTILAQTGIASGGSVAIKGNIAASTADSITGFALAYVPAAPFSTSAQVTGNVYLSTYGDPTPSDLGTASGYVGTAYTTGMGIAPIDTNFNGGEIGGQLLAPGVHKWTTPVTISADLTLTGDANDVWIFQIAGGITQFADTSITLAGGAKPKNVFWLPSTTLAIGAGCHFEGVVLAQTTISVGASSTIDGRLFSQTNVALGAGVIVSYPEYIAAKYDLSDQVRTAYTTGVNTKYLAGAFATFLKTKIAAGGIEKLVSSSGETNVYTAAQSAAGTGPQFNGIKFGSSSANGTVTLTFQAGSNINKVVVGCAGWASPNTDTLTIGGVTHTPTQGGVGATVEVIEFTFAGTDTITITTTKRIIFNYISVYHI